jgi:YVTN family beta-propeller protein
VSSPAGIAITPNGVFAYVVTLNDTVSVIATASNTVAATIPVTAPQQVAITPDGAFAYVSTFFNTVAVIATATNSVSAAVPVGAGSFGIAILVKPVPGPTSKDQCKNGGWQIYNNPPFKNQGDCIKYVHQLP